MDAIFAQSSALYLVHNPVHIIPLLSYETEGKQQQGYFTLKVNIPITITIVLIII